ncbi:MAG: hypothetical protein ACTHOH_12990 [Lysobacteraceae bacterium]
MQTTLAALLLLASATASAAIVPTDDPGSDCVAATITTERTSQNRPYDERYCAVNEDPAARAICLHNTESQQTIAFFTDRCGAPEDGAFVSFNGETHHVLRQSRAAHPDVTYAGTYRGDGVTVRVLPRKRIARSEEGALYRVDVVIESGSERATIHGIYDSRP